MRGFFAIGIESGKSPLNIGTLWRSAHMFGAAYIFTIGARYPKARGGPDTTKAWRHIPLFEYSDLPSFLAAIPRDCELIALECGQGKPRSLPAFKHPERAVYVLGAEDRGLSQTLLDACLHQVEIPSIRSLNVAVAGSIILYDRIAKSS